MKKSFAARLLALFACGALASAAGAAGPRLGKFVEYDVGPFTIYTSRGERQVRDLMDDLALFQVTLERSLKHKAAQTGIPTRVFIVGHNEWEKYLQPSPGLAGVFLSRRFMNYMIVDGDTDGESARQIIFHEYTHFFLRSQFAGEYPPWFHEGLAELFSMCRFKQGNAEFGLPVQRIFDARAAKWIPFDRMLAIDQNSPEYSTHRLAPGFYGQAWFTVHYGMVENRVFREQMFDYLHQLNLLVPRGEAQRKAFGADLGVIDKQLFEYSRRPRLSLGSVSIGDAPALTLGPGRVLDELETLFLVANLMFEFRNPPERLAPFIAAAEKREPGSFRTLKLGANLARSKDDVLGFASKVDEMAGALSATDWQARRDLGVLVLTDAMEDQSLRPDDSRHAAALARAAKWFDEALAQQPEDVPALWGYGYISALREENLDLAEERLKTAYRKAPANAEIAMALASVYNARREPENAVPVLKDVIRYATDLGMREWAVKTLDSITAFLDERDAARASLEREVEQTRRREKERKKRQ